MTGWGFCAGDDCVSHLVYQSAHRPAWRELLKAVLLAITFLFWATNQVSLDARVARF